jgi:hypothetical protein
VVTLPDEIIRLFKLGKIPKRFRVADIERHLAGQFAQNYIRTALANFEKGGNYVQRWSAPRFRRVGRGLYEVY